MKPALASIFCLVTTSMAAAQDAKYQPTIDKGLAWLVKQQAKDGRFGDDKELSLGRHRFCRHGPAGGREQRRRGEVLEEPA